MPDEDAPSVELEVRPDLELENIRLRLANIEHQLELVLRMACPVCRPALVAQIHPEADWHDHAEWAVVKANGAHGE